MATAAWVLCTTALVLAGCWDKAAGAPPGGARLRVWAGGDASCPWRVALLDARGEDGGRRLCTRELAVSFEGSLNIAEHPAPTNSTLITEVPLLAATQSSEATASDIVSVVKTGAEEGMAAPEGFERLRGGGAYRVHAERRPWHLARRACERQGARLLVVQSAAAARALRDLLAPYDTINALHAGFRLDLRTTKGDRLSYESWSTAGPTGRFCGQMDNYLWLRYGSCAEKLPFICEYEPRPSAVAEQNVLEAPNEFLPTAECSKVRSQLLRERGYVPLPGWNRTLIKNLGKKTWQQFSWEMARKECENDGSQLVTINSGENADALVAFLESSKIEYFFVGVKTGDPVTVLGRRVQDLPYQLWESKQPEAACFYSTKKLLYNSITCNSGGQNSWIHVICQVNVN